MSNGASARRGLTINFFELVGTLIVTVVLCDFNRSRRTLLVQHRIFKQLYRRLGEPVKCVIDGDLRQSALPHGMPSGLEDAIYRFTGSPGFARVDFTRDDIVRSGLCRIIVEGYDEI